MLVDDLLYYSGRILDCYDILKQKELKNQKDDLEYNYYLEEIKKFNKEENDIYKGIKYRGDVIHEASFILASVIETMQATALPLMDSILLNDRQFLLGSKVPRNILVLMRINHMLSELVYESEISKDNMDREMKNYLNGLNKVVIPSIDKRFIDMLDDHIAEAKDFKDIRKTLIDIKYDYAYVMPQESEKELKELDEQERIVLSCNIADMLLEYTKIFVCMSKNSYYDPENQRLILAMADYVRALNLEIKNDYFIDKILSTHENQQYYVNALSGTINERNNFGLNVVQNLLDFKEEDSLKYDDDNFIKKRKF